MVANISFANSSHALSAALNVAKISGFPVNEVLDINRSLSYNALNIPSCLTIAIALRFCD